MKTLALALVIAISPVIMSSSCKQLGTDGNPCAGVMCTMMFAMVTVEVKDIDGNAVKLDEVYTVRERNNTRLQMDQGMAEGRYNVLDDSYQKVIANTTESFRLVGFKNGVKLVDEPYSIGADCCHVSKQSGKSVIVVH